MEGTLLCHHATATSARYHGAPMVRRRIHRGDVMEHKKPPAEERRQRTVDPTEHSMADTGPASTRPDHHRGAGDYQSAHTTHPQKKVLYAPPYLQRESLVWRQGVRLN